MSFTHDTVTPKRDTLQFVEEICRKLKVQALPLEVERSNPVAYWADRKQGFTHDDRCLMTKWIPNV